ncbi:MAG: MFS transporter [Pseudomonadota bacterium]
MSQPDETVATAPAPYQADRYAWYVLSVLVLVYVLNFVDRQIISILANDIKRDLDLTDADLGFLYGTAFGVFYSLFGIPLGKLADGWNRTRLLTAGLGLWSIMTTLSGFAKNGTMLAGARIGVGIGEATASPSAYSLISDWFPKEKRATALAIYSSGLYLGGGLSLLVGGQIVERWDAAFPDRSGPFGLAGWQAAFMAVGIPGLLLALWVSTLREPFRGQADGIKTPPADHPFRNFFAELMTVLPPLTLISAARLGRRAFVTNVIAAVAVIGAAAILIRVTGSTLQWIAVGIGVYAVFSWASALRYRDLPAFRLIWGTPAFLCTTLGYGLIAFQSYAVSFWAAPYAERVLLVSKSEAGFLVGAPGALAGFLGVIAGGRLADHLRKTNPAGRLLVVMLAPMIGVIPFIIAFTTSTPAIFYIGHFVSAIFTSAALGGTAATSQDLVLPRMRGIATATFFVATTLVGLSLGPYMAGQVSSITGDLSVGILSVLAVAPISIGLLIVAYRTLPKAEATLLERARAAGEPV